MRRITPARNLIRSRLICKRRTEAAKAACRLPKNCWKTKEIEL